MRITNSRTILIIIMIIIIIGISKICRNLWIQKQFSGLRAIQEGCSLNRERNEFIFSLVGLWQLWQESEKEPRELPEDMKRLEDEPLRGDYGGEMLSRV